MHVFDRGEKGMLKKNLVNIKIGRSNMVLEVNHGLFRGIVMSKDELKPSR